MKCSCYYCSNHTQQIVQNGTYALTRSLTFLTKGTLTEDVKDCINSCLSPKGQAIVNNAKWNNSNNDVYDPSLEIGASGG